ncbi:hypothetical protein NY08_42 [Rhodococcus sp. B7740]|nr:hypothetical protein NY08_42 [Rhodococcus sp. B7740]
MFRKASEYCSSRCTDPGAGVLLNKRAPGNLDMNLSDPRKLPAASSTNA